MTEQDENNLSNNEALSDHERRIQNLETQHQELYNKITNVENTVMRSSMTTQELQQDIKQMQDVTNRHQDDIKKMQEQSNEKVDKVFDLLYGLAEQNQQNKSQKEQTKMTTRSKIVVGIALAIFGGGGLISFIDDVVGLF